MLKWTLRVIGGLFLFIVLSVACVFGAFKFWLYQYEKSLLENSQIASTKLGDIEYAIYGEGTPRLVIHGTPGGYEQALISPKTHPEDFSGTQVIAVSRPGYLRTPLSSGRTLAEQADLFAELLNELQYDRVTVLAASGGGPAGLMMAIRHPERVKALILLVPILTPDEDEAWDPPSNFLYTIQDLSVFLLRKQLALRFIPGLDENDPAQIAHAKLVLLGNTPAKPRLDGQKNDIEQFAALDIENWPLEQVTVPTLLLHGDADNNAPYEGSLSVSKRIPNANLITFRGEDHFMIITRAKDINQEIKNFLATLEDG